MSDRQVNVWAASSWLVSILLAGSVQASVIDNGTMGPVSGGSCSTCSDLDSVLFTNFDDLSLTGDSSLNFIDFEIALYSDPAVVVDTDFRIQLWNDLHTTLINQWDFNGSEVVNASFVGIRTFTITFDLGDYFVSAGEYELGIASDFGVHGAEQTFYTPGAASDGVYVQYVGNTFSRIRFGDLPFRLTVNEQVPEPGTLALFSLGLASIGVARNTVRLKTLMNTTVT